MKFFSRVFASAITLALASGSAIELSTSTRDFLPRMLKGTYTCTLPLGSNCPQTVAHSGLGGGAVNGAPVPFSTISHNGQQCSGGGLELLSADSSRANRTIQGVIDNLELPIVDSAFETLSSETTPIYGTETEKRSCGSAPSLSAPAIYAFVYNPDSDIVLVPAVAILRKNRRYILMAAQGANRAEACLCDAPAPQGAESPKENAEGGTTEPLPEATEGGDSPGETDEPVCFPGRATVELEDGTLKAMSAVTVGDRVRVSKSEFSEVFMFTHKMAGVRNKFVNIHLRDVQPLTLTHGHYLYVNGKLAAARTAIAGDSVELASGETAFVERVSVVMEEGLYNPQTVHGDIIVNGVRASTYTTIVEPRCAHAMLSPLRAVFNALGFATASLDNGAELLARIAPGGTNAL